MEDADVQSEVSEHDGSRTPEEVADYAEERASSPTTPTEKSADIPAVPPESLAAVHFNAPAKEFWEKEFKDQEKTHEATGTPRGKTRYFGTCKKCGKIVSGTESFWCFRQHCQTKHFEAYAGIEVCVLIRQSKVSANLVPLLAKGGRWGSLQKKHQGSFRLILLPLRLL